MSCTPNDSTAPAFLTHFQSVEDPRQQGKVLYPLEEIFLLVLCGCDIRRRRLDVYRTLWSKET